MQKGKVIKISEDRFYGLIKPDSGGETVYFQLQWVRNTQPENIIVGARLDYEATETTRGMRAKSVRLATDSSQMQTTSPRKTDFDTSSVEGRQKSYRFLNPYNFIRTPRAPQSFEDDPDSILLGRCAPPPHDRFVGLTGQIDCQIEAVSPLFVSGSDFFYASPEDEAVDHRTYRFFRYDFENDPNQPELRHALPASSLRGMTRSVFEAVTNSCFAHFTYGKRLSFHLPANDALKLTPARVEKDEQGRLRLLLLPGTAQITIGSRPSKLYAARVERYDALRPVIKRKDGKRPVFREVALNGLGHKERCYALAESLNFPPVWNVLRLASSRSDLEKHRKSGQEILEGYLCLNNQNIESKRFERFFFKGSDTLYSPLSDDVCRKYAELIEDYQKRHEDTIKNWKRHKPPFSPDKPRDKSTAAFSRFVIGGPSKIQEGDLVYAMLTGSLRSPEVEFIVPVAVPRLGYKRKMDQLLPHHLWKCEQQDQLCPACRTFGWVYGNERQPEDQIPLDKQVAYAGRLQFSHAKLLEDTRPTTLPTTTLSILGSPKPTTTRFYLKPVDHDPQKGQDDYQAGYDNIRNVFRGRKMYRHQGHAGDRKYWSDEHREYHLRKRSDQNRSVEDALLPGAKFEFKIRFENLSQVELGALLWALELDGKGYHRLGFAKPLGFGSIRVSVNNIRLMQPTQRYAPDLASGFIDGMAQKIEWVDLFKQALERAYGRSFAELEQVRDLLALASDPEPDLPIHYPRTDIQRDPEGKNFEWFMGNNRSRDARYVLEMAGKEKGLPLIDKFGNEK